ncbi:MAG: VCBS repeat-containing protein [Ignavibacteriae bacterium]|nr:VCBS repeat-containing protein [Ignavibacteriota bacterium]
MKKFVQLIATVALLLLLGLGSLVAQEVGYSIGPPVTPPNGASNGGFAWLDINGDGIQDVWIPPNNVLLNNITYFTAVPTANVSRLTGVVNSVGGLFADVNGDGVPDIWSTNNAAPQTGLFYDSAGVYVPPTAAGDLTIASSTGSVFAGMAVADIDHSNYLSAAWHGFKQAAWSDGFIYKPGEGITLLKGGPSGFTKAGIGSAPGNLAIDTSRAFETWDVHFLDANNDGWVDLWMPSFRHGFRAFAGGSDTIGAKKGSILYLNNGTGRFYVPNATTLGRTLYAVDSLSGGVFYGRAIADTGIIVEDTVRHFNAIGSTFGDLNNDGKWDLIMTGTEANNYDGLRRATNIVLLYGKGDGTFTFKWNGSNIVDAGLPTSGGIRAWDIGDYNNDQIPDVYASTTFGATRLFRGNGNGTFTEVTNQNNVTTAGGGRAGGFVDYNNDGFLDIYNYTGLNSVLQKSSGNSNHWIGFTPVGIGHNKNAVGAVFTLYTQSGAIKQYRYIKGEGNAAGHGEMRALFGIGINTSIDSVVVRWPDGTRGSYTGLAIDRYWTVNQGSTIPNMPSLVSPPNNATAVPQTGNLQWNAATGATGYRVQASLDATFANAALLAVNRVVTGTSYAYSLGAATKYYWRVAAVNGGFMSDYTAAFNFTTTGSAATQVPTIVAPVSGSTNQPALLTLKVRRTTDASRYNWQVSTLPSFTTFVVNATTADTTYAGQFTGGQTFYLRARGMNDLGSSTFSAIDTFTIMPPPGRTTLLAPTNNAVNVPSDSVVFVWRVVPNTASYNLQLSTVNTSVTYNGLTDTTYKVRNLAKLTNYSWKVEAINAGGTGYYTTAFAFTTIIAVPGQPQPSAPAANATGVSRNPKFTWGPVATAAKYRLQIATDNAFATIIRDTVVYEDTLCILGPAHQLGSEVDYFWRLYAGNVGGFGNASSARLFTTGTTAVEEYAGVPTEYALMQNYPNPFNPTTIIRYDIPKSSNVKLTIYDVLGREVATLVNEVQTVGRHRIEWNAVGVSTGVYFYRIEAKGQDGAGSFTAVKKLLFMK